MRLVHISLKKGRWSYMSMGRAPKKDRQRAAAWCGKLNKEQGR